MSKLQHKMTKFFLNLALLVALCVTDIQTVSIDDSGALGSITNSSSSQDVLDAVSSLKNGNLCDGVDEVLKKLHAVIQNQIDNANNTIKENCEDKNCSSIFETLCKSLNKNLKLHLDENHPEKSVTIYNANTTDSFLQNVTKSVYKNMEILEELSVQYKTNNSVDTDEMLGIIISVHDEIIYSMQIYDEKIATSLQNLLNANSLTIVDDNVKAERDISSQLTSVLTTYYTVLESKKKNIEDAASGKTTKTLDEIVKNLKSIKNRKKTMQKVKRTIRDVKNKLNGQTFTVDEEAEALKANKASEFYSYQQMINLQAGYNLILGVNDISKSKVLKEAVNSLNKTDHKELINKVADSYKQISETFKMSLAEILKTEILGIKNPSIGSDFQIATDCYSEVGKHLTKATKIIEQSNSKKSSSSGSGDSDKTQESSSKSNEKSGESQESSSNKNGDSSK